MLAPSATSVVRLRLRFLLPALCALIVLLAPARGDAEEAPIVVVDIRASAAELDPVKLAAAIGAELHATAVLPADARAANAQGTVTVDLDRGKNEVAVTYLARERPLSRRVSLPPDADAARTAVVSLAGNLARNEAADLAAELRRGQTKPATEPTAKVDTANNDAAKDESARREREESDNAGRLQRTLNHYAIADDHARWAYGWTLTAVGAVATGADLYVSTRPDGHSVSSLGPVFVAFGLTTLLTDGPYDKLIASTRNTSVHETEAQWARDAAGEHRVRWWTGVSGLVVTGAALTIGTIIAVDKDWSMSDRARQDWATGLFLEAAVIGSFSGYVLGTEGPMEQGLHAYEHTVGRSITAKEAATLHFGLSPTRGGAFAGVGGTF